MRSVSLLRNNKEKVLLSNDSLTRLKNRGVVNFFNKIARTFHVEIGKCVVITHAIIPNARKSIVRTGRSSISLPMHQHLIEQ